MQSFTYLWSRTEFEWQQSSAHGQFELAKSKLFSSRDVRRGDQLYVISFFNKRLHLLGRFVAASDPQFDSTSATELIDADNQHSSPMCFDLIVPQKVVRVIRFEGDVPPKFRGNEPDPQTFRSVRRLTEVTAQKFDELIAVYLKTERNRDIQSAIREFHDTANTSAHDDFQSWRAKNLDGFFINCKTKAKWMLHRVACQHPGGTHWGLETGHSLTVTRKLCSDNADELLRLASSNESVSLEFCQDCSPPRTILRDHKVIAEVSKRLQEEGEFDPATLDDARQHVIASIVQRRGQSTFRQSLLRHHGGRCMVSGCDVEDVLDAAHVVPYKGPKTNHSTNGLLLRTDLHSLFDLGLLAVDADSMTILLHETLLKSDYGKLAGKRLRLPEQEKYWPNLNALRQHRKLSGL